MFLLMRSLIWNIAEVLNARPRVFAEYWLLPLPSFEEIPRSIDYRLGGSRRYIRGTPITPDRGGSKWLRWLMPLDLCIVRIQESESEWPDSVWCTASDFSRSGSQPTKGTCLRGMNRQNHTKM